MQRWACNFIKKRLQHRGFSVKFANFLGTSSLTEHLRWLLLNKPRRSLCLSGRKSRKTKWSKESEFKQKNKTQKKLPVTVILYDSLVKDIKGWELSDESSKVVTKHFSGANTTDVKSYLLPTKHAIQKISFFIVVQTTWRKKTVRTKSVMTSLKLTCCINLITTTY